MTVRQESTPNNEKMGTTIGYRDGRYSACCAQTPAAPESHGGLSRGRCSVEMDVSGSYEGGER